MGAAVLLKKMPSAENIRGIQFPETLNLNPYKVIYTIMCIST